MSDQRTDDLSPSAPAPSAHASPPPGPVAPPPAAPSPAQPQAASGDPTAGIPTGGLLREQPSPTELTSDEKLWGCLASVLMLPGAVLALLLQGQSKFVKFNALQMIFFCIAFFPVMIALAVVMTFLSFVPILAWVAHLFMVFLMPFVGLTIWVLCLAIAIKANNGFIVRLPFIGDMAYRSAYGDPAVPAQKA